MCGQGIGFAIAKKLAQTEGHICVLAARDESRGQKAAQDLQQEEGVTDTAIVFKQLDIGNPVSVDVSIDLCLYIPAGYRHESAAQSVLYSCFELLYMYNRQYLYSTSAVVLYLDASIFERQLQLSSWNTLLTLIAPELMSSGVTHFRPENRQQYAYFCHQYLKKSK